MSWQKNHILLLIDLYKKEPVLYCTTHKDYRNRNEREAAWNRIIAAVAKVRPSTGVRDIRDKIENLRTVYALQKRRVEISLERNGGIYIPTIWYYRYLSFLDDFLTQRKSNREHKRKNCQTSDVLDCNFLHTEGYESIIEELLKPEDDKKKPVKRVRKRKFQNVIIDDDGALKNIEVKDRYSAFGSYIADRLRLLGDETSQKLEKDIVNLIMKEEKTSKSPKISL